MRVMKFITVVSKTSSSSGKEMFKTYCAVCHGLDGKGNGPAAPAMKTNPTDLTALAQKSGGKYPAPHVAAVIRGQAESASHGRQDMPVWGPLFSVSIRATKPRFSSELRTSLTISRAYKPG
jgi:mono/diheme cytochrome c family protein